MLLTGQCWHEDSDDLVPHELAHNRVMVDEQLGCRIEEALHQVSELRRSHALGEERRAAHVGEQEAALNFGAP
jgi:hypothetical protein